MVPRDPLLSLTSTNTLHFFTSFDTSQQFNRGLDTSSTTGRLWIRIHFDSRIRIRIEIKSLLRIHIPYMYDMYTLGWSVEFFFDRTEQVN